MADIRERLILVDNFSAAFTSFISCADQAAGQNEKVQSSMQRTSAAADDLADRLKRLAGAYLSLQGAQRLISLADAYTQTTARLDRMNDGLQETAELQQMIMASAQRSRGAYQDTADMVGKLGTLAGEAFSSTAEIVAFAEQLNKQFALAGTSAEGQAAAMLQLTQAMASGVLRGEELNSVLEQAPTITQSIAKYQDITTGELRQIASEGKITAEVVKAAMFAAADETNAAFESIPLTWAQMWTGVQNVGLDALQPLFEALQGAPQLIADNWDSIEPILMAVGVGLGILTAATLAQAAAQWVANAAMAASPVTWIALAIAGLVLVIYAAVEAYNEFTGQSVSAMGVITGVFAAGGAFILNTFVIPVQRQLANLGNFLFNVFQDPIGAVEVFFLDMAKTVLGYIQSIAQGIEDLLNAIPGVQLSLTGVIDRAYNALADTSASVKEKRGLEDHFKAWDYMDLGNAYSSGYDWGANLSGNVSGFFSGIGGGSADDLLAGMQPADYLADIDKNVAGIAKSVDMSKEDLKSLTDMAERQYINQINLTSQSPVIQVSGTNTGNTEQDRAALANAIRDVLLEQSAAGSIRSPSGAVS